MINYFDLGMNLKNALATPRLSQRNTESTLVETGYTLTAEANFLASRGHHWSEDSYEIGAASPLSFGPNGYITAVSEPVRHGVGSALVQSHSPFNNLLSKSL